jgi:O-antigen/teichoic acid export membrane protein
VSDRNDPLREEGLAPEVAADVRTIAKGGAVQIAGQATQNGLSFFFAAIAIRILGAAGFGLYRQVAQVLALCGQLGLAGFNYASVRFISLARANRDHAAVRGAARVGVTGALVASAIAATVLVLGARPLAAQFADRPADAHDIARLMRLGAAYVPLFAVMQVLRYCTQAYKTMVPSVVVGNIVQPLVRFVVGVAALLAGFAVAGAVTSLVASVAVGASAAAFYFHRMPTLEERSARPRPPVAEMVRFALPQAGASLLGIQTLGLGIIVLGIFSRDRQVGLFAIALALQGPGTLFLGGIVNIWAPVVSDLHGRGEIERLGDLYQTINRWIATFSFPVFVALILEPGLFVRFFGGSEAAGATSVVAILAAGNIFYTGTGPTGYVISMTGRPAVNFANSVVAVGLYFVLGASLASRYGAVGMAWVDAGVTAAVNIARVVEAKLLVGVQPFGRTFVKPVLATAAGTAVLLAWRLVAGEGTVLEIAGLTLAAVVYLGTLLALGVDPEERMVLDRIKGRALRRGPRGSSASGSSGE